MNDVITQRSSTTLTSVRIDRKVLSLACLVASIGVLTMITLHGCRIRNIDTSQSDAQAPESTTVASESSTPSESDFRRSGLRRAGPNNKDVSVHSIHSSEEKPDSALWLDSATADASDSETDTATFSDEKQSRLLNEITANTTSATTTKQPEIAKESSETEHVAQPAEGTLIIAIGASGASGELSPQVMLAVDASVASIAKGASALHAAVEGMAVLESNPLFNAGTGSALRRDGSSIRMDAFVMDCMNSVGAVGGIATVRHPVRVALDIANEKLGMLASTDAVFFARNHGHWPFDPLTSQASKRWQRAMSDVSGHVTQPSEQEPQSIEEQDGRTSVPWQPKAERAPIYHPAIIVRDGKRGFAAACSDGGQTGQAVGKIGACFVAGASVFVGEKGGVIVSGPSEVLVKNALAKGIYTRIANGESPKQAIKYALEQSLESSSDRTGESFSVAVAAVGFRSHFMTARGPVAWASYPTDLATENQHRGKAP